MLHRHLMISDDGRVAKTILLEQKKYEINDCLMSEMKSDAEELNVNMVWYGMVMIYLTYK